MLSSPGPWLPEQPSSRRSTKTMAGGLAGLPTPAGTIGRSATGWPPDVSSSYASPRDRAEQEVIAVAFRGWPAEALEFFEGLEADNSKAYWQRNREEYE